MVLMVVEMLPFLSHLRRISPDADKDGRRSSTAEWETEADILANLSEADLDQLRSVWSKFDSHQTGKISTGEMLQALQLLGMNPTSGDVDDYVKLLDRNNDGFVDFLEFARAWFERRKGLDRADQDIELTEAFKVLDRDGNGVISASELRKLFTTVGERMTDAEVDQLLAEADADQNGIITLSEFKKLACWWE